MSLTSSQTLFASRSLTLSAAEQSIRIGFTLYLSQSVGCMVACINSEDFVQGKPVLLV